MVTQLPVPLSGSGEALQVGHGSLYPALHRLLKLGLLTAEDGIPRMIVRPGSIA